GRWPAGQRGVPHSPCLFTDMHPALSIIAFTTLSGLGYGLAVMLGLGLFDPAAMATRAAHVTALVLIGAGLCSSTLHLGSPQRAWRALPPRRPRATANSTAIAPAPSRHAADCPDARWRNTGRRVGYR